MSALGRCTALYRAAMLMWCGSLWLRGGADVNALDGYGRSALQSAVTRRSDEVHLFTTQKETIQFYMEHRFEVHYDSRKRSNTSTLMTVGTLLAETKEELVLGRQAHQRARRSEIRQSVSLPPTSSVCSPPLLPSPRTRHGKRSGRREATS